MRIEESIVMGAQILKWPHSHFNAKPLRPPRKRVSLNAERTIRLFRGKHRGPNVTNVLRHGAIVLATAVTLLAALAICTATFIVVLKYATNEANRTFYEMKYSQLPSTER
jgi:hypothetical protein